MYRFLGCAVGCVTSPILEVRRIRNRVAHPMPPGDRLVCGWRCGAGVPTAAVGVGLWVFPVVGS